MSIVIISFSIICLAIGQIVQDRRIDNLHKWTEDVTTFLNDREVERIPSNIFKPKVVQLKERTDAEKIEYFSNKFTEYYAKYHKATLEIKKLEKELRKNK